MRKNRILEENALFVDANVLLTEPNEAFTPRQIIEQFSRNELSAKIFEPTDDIDDSRYSDDEMVDNAIEFSDHFEAMEYMRSTKFEKVKKEAKNVSSEKHEDRQEASEGSDGKEG